MITKIFSEPAVECVSLQELKEHLRLDSGAFNDNLTVTQSIAPAAYDITYELMTLDVAPGGAGWAVGDTITGQTSNKTCIIVTVITTLTYIVKTRSGAFTLGEIITNGAATADQGPAYPTFATGYTIIGAYVDTLGYQAIVSLDSGLNAATGTVDAKIQESDDHVTWTDWTGGGFTQVTTGNDMATQKISYTGTKQYIRPVAKVLLATCSFGVQVFKYSSDTTEDALLTTLITAARKQAEAFTRRQFVTSTWDAYLDAFPSKNFIALPYGQLQSIAVGAFTYTDNAGTVTTMVVTTDYLLDIVSEPGRIILPYGVSWPSLSAYPIRPIAIRYVCGYGAASAVPAGIRTAIKMMVADLYQERGERILGQSMIYNKAAEMLLWPYRLWDEF